MAEPALRQRLVEDLRDSPYRKHRIRLAGYLRGTRGLLIAQAAARRAGLTVGRLQALADARQGGLHIYMPRVIDRANWKGTDDIVVFGSNKSLGELATSQHVVYGYTTGGQRTKISLWGYASFPYIAVLPPGATDAAEFTDLRTRGHGAPKPSNTISTPEEEQEMMFVSSSTEEEECGPWSVIECDYPIGGWRRTGIVLPSGRRREDCYRPTGFPKSVDIDQDFVLDDCEYELAYQFRPRMAFDLQDDNLDREPYWAVRHVLGPVEAFRIFYAISYREDGGTPTGGFFSHQGDSEWVIIEVNTDVPSNPGTWVVKRATLSAHWGAATDETATYAGEDLEYADVYLGRPVIWVAEDKHANYRSQSVCDSGALYFDACDHGADRGETVEILPFATGNLGQGPNRGVILIDCIGSRRGFPDIECFWTEPNKFRGWLTPDPDDDGAGPYHLSLTFFGF